MNAGIYSILNKQNGKIYIGQSINLKKRINKHLNQLLNNKHENKHLQRSFNKYGEKNFEFNIIEHCQIKDLNKNERWWISFFKSNSNQFGYNKQSGGNSNYKRNNEIKQKISKSLKGKNHYNYGKQLSDETCKKISEGNTGKKYSKETRKKMSDSQKRFYNSKEGIEKKKLMHNLFKGKNSKFYGKKQSEGQKQKMRLNLSKATNTSGYFRVSKYKHKKYKQGFIWLYSYYNENNKRCVIRRVNIVDLKEEVLKRGLDWIEY